MPFKCSALLSAGRTRMEARSATGFHRAGGDMEKTGRRNRIRSGAFPRNFSNGSRRALRGFALRFEAPVMGGVEWTRAIKSSLRQRNSLCAEHVAETLVAHPAGPVRPGAASLCWGWIIRCRAAYFFALSPLHSFFSFRSRNVCPLARAFSRESSLSGSPFGEWQVPGALPSLRTLEGAGSYGGTCRPAHLFSCEAGRLQRFPPRWPVRPGALSTVSGRFMRASVLGQPDPWQA